MRRQARSRSSRTYQHTNTIFEMEKVDIGPTRPAHCHNPIEHRVVNIVTPEQLAHKNKGKGYPCAVKNPVQTNFKPLTRKLQDQQGQLHTNGTEFYWLDNDKRYCTQGNDYAKRGSIPTTVGFLDVGYEPSPKEKLKKVANSKEEVQLKRRINESSIKDSKTKIFIFGCCKHSSSASKINVG